MQIARTDAREKLLKAAERVFVERGYHGASIDEVARRAGYSKGAVYWHFASKDDLFFALVESRVDAPTREMIALLRSAPADQDMAPEASSRFARQLAEDHDWLLLDHDYWAQAVRDPAARERYARHQAELRAALAESLAARASTLGSDDLGPYSEWVATIALALSRGLAQQSLVDPDAVPDDLLGETIALIYAGLVARNEAGTGPWLRGGPGPT